MEHVISSGSRPGLRAATALEDGERADIPRVSPFRGLLRYRSDRIGLLGELGRERRDIVESRLGGLRLVVVTEPRLAHQLLVDSADRVCKGPAMARHAPVVLGQGLLTSHGESHRRQRKLLAPRFTPRHVASYASTMVELTGRMLQRWRVTEPGDIAAEMARLTLAIAAETMFGADVAGDYSVMGEALEVANHYVIEESTSLVRVPRALPTRRNRELRARLGAANELIHRLIRERRARGGDTPDVLSALMGARDDDGSGIDDELIRDEVMTFFLAGHETTTTALSWAYHVLGRTPAVARAVADEVDRVLGGRAPTHADVARLPVTTRALQEVMRLYPPIYMIGRQAMTDVPLGPYTVRGGSYVVVNVYGLHRRGDFFADPTEVRPERFAGEPTWPRGAFIPFGLGPRVCIGNHFAMMEGVLILAMLAQAIEFRCDADVDMEPLITLRPRGGIPFRPVWRRS